MNGAYNVTHLMGFVTILSTSSMTIFTFDDLWKTSLWIKVVLVTKKSLDQNKTKNWLALDTDDGILSVILKGYIRVFWPG
jgi:hypothetical protein